MRTITIKKGLDLPIQGRPVQEISEGNQPGRVGLVGSDYVGLKPKITVSVGARVKVGQLLFTDKGNPSVRFTSPGTGTVSAIHRGAKRVLQSIVIDLDGDDETEFDSFPESRLASLDRDAVVNLLVASGLWTALRVRPFSRVPDPGTAPHSLFVAAMDTNPLAPSVAKILEGNERDFTNGLTVLSKLTAGKMFLCKARGDRIPEPELESHETVNFRGPHPAGNVGTHIHFLDAIDRTRHVWHLGAQDVVAIGKLFTTGRLDVGRVVSLAGPSVRNPRLLRTRIGASVGSLTSAELREGKHRLISGSVLSGHRADGEQDFLGRYHQQVSVIPEGAGRRFVGWLRPALDRFSMRNTILARLLRKTAFEMTTATHGSLRALYPIGTYEKVMPFHMVPTSLMRALAVDDIEEAERLGCLELDEEDLALCTFVCPSKIDHGALLRRNLDMIEKEGL